MRTKWLLPVIALLVLLSSLVGCSPNDPIQEDMYIDADFYQWDGAAWVPFTTGGGDVVGPAVATDHGLVRYDGVTGRLIEDSAGTLLDDFANLFLGGDLTAADINAGNDVNVTNDLDVTDDASIGGILDVGETFSVTGTSAFNDQIGLVGDGKVWIEFRPELDFDIVRKNAVPVSYERGIFTGFELPIYAADDQELFFEICVPDRWDGISTTHVHLDCFLIDAQDAGDAFNLQIAYEHYDAGTDVVPATSTLLPVETPTGASAAFQSFHVHFDVPAGDMLGDDILAFRLRRIAVGVGVEIDNNVVFNHAGVIFLCDKLGNDTAE